MARSDSLELAASFSLKSSSDIPAQLSISATVPVTFPTFMVSLTASERPSIGMESPYVAQAPMTPLVISSSLLCSSPMACKFAVVVAAD